MYAEDGNRNLEITSTTENVFIKNSIFMILVLNNQLSISKNWHIIYKYYLPESLISSIFLVLSYDRIF